MQDIRKFFQPAKSGSEAGSVWSKACSACCIHRSVLPSVAHEGLYQASLCSLIGAGPAAAVKKDAAKQVTLQARQLCLGNSQATTCLALA